MSMFKKVAIIGTGLIGGSIALGLRKERLAGEIIGVSRRRKNLSLAKKMGAIDRGSKDLDILKGAELVILATPVNAIKNQAAKIAGLVKPECIVCDVGSTKEEIVADLSKIFPRFIGCHPLAGSEKRGISNADAGLFKNTSCILTPIKNTDKRALAKIERLWVKLGSRVITLNPKAHDRILSYVSHLPHLVSFSLMNCVPSRYFKFCANSLRDTTRIAASDAELWSDIFLSNKKNILKAVGALQKNLSAVKTALLKEDRAALFKIIKTAKAKREALK
jgi:prephenate dehydrogenase